MKIADFKTAASFLLAKDDFRIICHDRPDGDTLGSAAALLACLEKLGKRAHLFCADPLPARLEFITSYCNKSLLHFESKEYKTEGFDPEYTVTVDVASRQLLSVDVGKVDLAIDHHMQNTVGAEYLLADSTCAAAGEIVMELIFEMEKTASECVFDKKIANLLYVAISSDSGNFMYSNTTEKTFLCAAKLCGCGADCAEISRLLFEVKNMNTFKSEALCIGRCERYLDGRLSLCAFSAEDMKNAGITDEDTETAVVVLRQIQGVEVGIFIREKKENTFKVSVRSNGNFDACAFCARFGGGGHIKAAGCTVCGTISEVKEQILSVAYEFLK